MNGLSSAVRIAVLSLVLAALSGVHGNRGQCPGFRELEVYETYPFSIVNSSTPGLSVKDSKYGIEGGQVVVVGDVFYLFITEFIGDPYFVPSRLALWSAKVDEYPFGWTRLETLFTSTGRVAATCSGDSDYRAALGSSITATYNDTASRWTIYYVGFESCNSSTFVNRNGRIFTAESTVQGMGGIRGPYKDVAMAIVPNVPESQPWEGLQGTDSFAAPWKVGSTWYSFYGSARTQDVPCCNQRVGLVHSESLLGPWVRAPYPQVNPISLKSPNNYTEQPLVTRFADGSFGAVFDALDEQNAGVVGYTWSSDGLTWNPDCFQSLVVNPPATGWGTARTPQGLVPINATHFYLFFSGYARHSEDPLYQTSFESFGVAKLRFKQQP